MRNKNLEKERNTQYGGRSAALEKEWKTEHGMRAIVAKYFLPNKVYFHRCGYVEIESNNGLYNVDYNKVIESADIFVHGGLTFSGSVPFFEGYWMGYDCAHSSDKTFYNPQGIERTLDFCISECEELSKQIHANSLVSLYFLSKKRKLSFEENRRMISYGLVSSLPNNHLVKEYFIKENLSGTSF